MRTVSIGLDLTLAEFWDNHRCDIFHDIKRGIARFLRQRFLSVEFRCNYWSIIATIRDSLSGCV